MLPKVKLVFFLLVKQDYSYFQLQVILFRSCPFSGFGCSKILPQPKGTLIFDNNYMNQWLVVISGLPLSISVDSQDYHAMRFFHYWITSFSSSVFQCDDCAVSSGCWLLGSPLSAVVQCTSLPLAWGYRTVITLYAEVEEKKKRTLPFVL